MAQMTFLQLAKRFREKCGAAGTGPATCQGQSGELLRLVNWINEAWLHVQEAHQDWEWMRTTVSFVTTAQKATYVASAAAGETGVTDLGNWKRDSFRSYITALGFPTEIRLTYLPYSAWRNWYQLGNLRTTFSRPVQHVTICPDKSLGLGMIPDSGAYTVVGEYYRTPSDLAADADIPAMPARFHMLIVYKAMMLYAAYEAAPEVYEEGAREYNKMFVKLEFDQQPDIEMAGPMA